MTGALNRSSVACGRAGTKLRFNRRRRRSGHLFLGRFKAHLVEEDAYARELVKYVQLDPARPENKRKPILAELKLRKGNL